MFVFSMVIHAYAADVHHKVTTTNNLLVVVHTSSLEKSGLELHAFPHVYTTSSLYICKLPLYIVFPKNKLDKNTFQPFIIIGDQNGAETGRQRVIQDIRHRPECWVTRGHVHCATGNRVGNSFDGELLHKM